MILQEHIENYRFDILGELTRRFREALRNIYETGQTNKTND